MTRKNPLASMAMSYIWIFKKNKDAQVQISQNGEVER